MGSGQRALKKENNYKKINLRPEIYHNKFKINDFGAGNIINMVVTHSSGNHGQAVAWAARQLGLPCTVVVPEGTPEVKCQAIQVSHSSEDTRGQVSGYTGESFLRGHQRSSVRLCR